jgi:hypothetical protein
MAAAWCFIVALALASGAAQPRSSDFRETTVGAIRAEPGSFHRQWVSARGTVVREGELQLLIAGGSRIRLLGAALAEGSEVEVRGQVLDVGRLSASEAATPSPPGQPTIAELYAGRWPARGQEIVLSVIGVERIGVEVPAPPLPLEVYFSTPLEGEADVRLDSVIRVQFSSDVDPRSLDGRVHASYSQSDSIERGEPQPPPIELKVTYNASNRSIEITPARPLERFRQVRVELSKGIIGTDGSVLRPWTLSFSTGGS